MTSRRPMEVELPGIQRFRCPHCDTPSGDIRQGRELEIESIEIDVPSWGKQVWRSIPASA